MAAYFVPLEIDSSSVAWQVVWAIVEQVERTGPSRQLHQQLKTSAMGSWHHFKLCAPVIIEKCPFFKEKGGTCGP